MEQAGTAAVSTNVADGLDAVLRMLETGCRLEDVAGDLRRYKSYARALGACDPAIVSAQAALLGECRSAIEDVLASHPALFGVRAGNTTLDRLLSRLRATCVCSPVGAPVAQAV